MRVGLLLPLGDERVPGVAATYTEISALATEVEAAGLDSIWFYDHLLMATGDEAPSASWEAWTLLTAIAATTRTIGLGTLVACNSFRHPALLARMAHTLAEISGDRFVLGVGAGWHEPEYRAFGFPFDHRVDRFAEALAIIATMLREGVVTLDGRYYQVRDCPLLPGRDGPTDPPTILVGAKGERMLRLVARWADAWNTAWYARPDDRFAGLRDALHAACDAEGRDPAAVAVTVGMLIGAGDKRVPAEPEAIADGLGAWRDQGVSELICWVDPSDGPGVAALADGVRRLRTSLT
jgi:alkanesulfonate monooxygenase SsuD/methylene tetrahydromethanopterin reductase-like flavin-dependent oxidoreductase (luciferase family)